MLETEYNYNANIIPFLCLSKFNMKNFKEKPDINKFKICISLKKEKDLPEVFFWIFLFFSSIKIKPHTTFQIKKKHIFGKKFLVKKFLNIHKIYNSKKIIWQIIYLTNIFMFYKASDINLIKIFPYKEKSHIRKFNINSINVFEQYTSLLNYATSYWTPINLIILLNSKNKDGFHFRFLLQNLRYPVI